MAFDSTSSDDVLNYGMNVLKRIYKIAKKKEDTTLMLGVADRLLVLYEGMSEIERTRRGPVGFARIQLTEEEDG